MSMPLADLIFLAFALSVDAFVVAFSYGLLIKKKRLSNGIKLSLSTGAGQFLMPVLGFLLTGSVHRYIAAWDHWLGFSVFTFLGVNVLREGWNHRNEEEDMPHVASLTLPTLMAVGIATSIDALVAGRQHLPFIRPVWDRPHPPCGASPRRLHRLHHLPVHGGRLFSDRTAAPLSDLSSGSGCRAHPHRPGRQNALRPFVLKYATKDDKNVFPAS